MGKFAKYIVITAGLALGPASALVARPEAPVFTEVTTNAGIQHHFFLPDTNQFHKSNSDLDFVWMTGGFVAEDFDGDGWIDLYALQCGGRTNLMYMNRGDGTFTNEAATRNTAIARDSIGAAAADYDNDGDIDIAVTCLTNRTFLLINDGSGHFSEAELTLDTDEFRRFASPSWGDWNGDGFLELVHGQWHGNRESMHFFTNSGSALFAFDPADDPLEEDSEDPYVFSPGFADVNGDRISDLLLVSDFTNSQVYRNTGTGFLERVTGMSGAGTDENGMGSAYLDYDNDGDLDWFVTSITDTNPYTQAGWGITGNRLYRNDGGFRFTDVTTEAGVRTGHWGWGAAAADFDLDGYLDIFHVNGWPEHRVYQIRFNFNDQPALLYMNQGNGSFTNVAAEAGVDDKGQGRGTAAFDYDNDGDLDLFVVNNQVLTGFLSQLQRLPGPPRLFRNDTTNGAGWLKVTLDGAPPFHRDGIGSRVYLETGGMTQMRELHASSGYLAHGPGRIAHFGTGTNRVADLVRAEWISGDATVLASVPVDQSLSLPSPAAMVSTNRIHAGESVHADGALVEPAGHPREWTIGGQVYADPVTHTFLEAGTHDMVLTLYATNGPGFVRREIRRIHVESHEVEESIMAGGFLDLRWSARSGYVYRVETATGPEAMWRPGPVFTAATDQTISTMVTADVPARIIRILETGP